MKSMGILFVLIFSPLQCLSGHSSLLKHNIPVDRPYCFNFLPISCNLLNFLYTFQSHLKVLSLDHSSLVFHRLACSQLVSHSLPLSHPLTGLIASGKTHQSALSQGIAVPSLNSPVWCVKKEADLSLVEVSMSKCLKRVDAGKS